MKNIYISLSLVLVCSLLMAQNKNTKEADKLYNRYEYVAAAKAYLKLVPKNQANTYVYLRLADCYYNVFNTTDAAKWYEKAIQKPQDAEIYFRYAQMLKANGNYEQANLQMLQFATLNPKDHRAIQFQNQPNYLEKLKVKNLSMILKILKKIALNLILAPFYITTRSILLPLEMKTQRLLLGMANLI